MKDMRLGEKEFTTSALAGVVGKAETRGMGEAFKELGKQTERYRVGLAFTGQQFTNTLASENRSRWTNTPGRSS